MSDIPNPSTDKPLSTAVIVGIEKERVDPYTLQVIEQLFPGHHGVEFLSRLLRLAMVKQIALPELGLPGVADVAVITVQNMRKLSTLIGMAYDTTEKYVVVLSRLRLLYKKRHRHQIELHFPLRRCQLPEPEILDTLDYRPKVTSFARQVKRRFVLLRKKSRTDLSAVSPVVAQVDTQSLAPLLVEDIRKILQQEVDSEVGSRLLRKIEGVVRYRCTQSQSLLLPQKGDSLTGGIHQERRLFEQKGDSESVASGQQSLLLPQKGDSCVVISDQQSLLLPQKGDSLTGGIHQERRLFEQKGDSWAGEGAYRASESTFSRQKGDSWAVAPGASLNDNVIISSNGRSEKDYDSDNDAPGATAPVQDHYSPGEAAKVGRQLAQFLEKSPQNTGGFVNKCKQCSRTVIRASVIDVLVHAAFPQVDPADERGRPKNRASWFHDACKKYAKPGTRIPAFIEKWLKTDLAWDEIEHQLNEAVQRYKRSMVADRSTADLVRQWLRGEIEQQALDNALQTSDLSQEKQPLTSAPVAANDKALVAPQPSVVAEKTWMDEAEAEILAEEILRDAGPFGVSKAVTKQEHGVHVVMLTWRGTTFSMKTPQQWRTHLEKVRPHFECLQQKDENNGTTQ